jgi:hypothetical protein
MGSDQARVRFLYPEEGFAAVIPTFAYPSFALKIGK